MGHGLEPLLKIFFLLLFSSFIFILISLQSSINHIMISDADSLNAADSFFNDVHGLQQLHSMEENLEIRRTQVRKVSGEDEREGKQALILEKFRVLLGLKSLKKSPHFGHDSEYGSSSPSPSPSPNIEAPAPAPVPVHPIHVHSHPPSPSRRRHSIPIPPPHKAHKKDINKGEITKIVVAVVVSAGATFVLSVLGLVWLCRKFRKRQKRSAKTASSRKGIIRGRSTKYASSQTSVNKKVSFNPGMDLFYLNTIDMDLEEHAVSCLKPTCEEAANTISNQNPSNFVPNEREESDQEAGKSDFDNVSCSSSTREIMPVPDSAESVKYELEGGGESSIGDRIVVPVDEFHSYSSDDESFHSFCDSHSSKTRLSNASEGSVGEATLENFTSNDLENSHSTVDSFLLNLPIPPPSPTSNSKPSCPPQSPPPPPPPPPPHVHFSPSSSSSTRITAKASCSSTLPNLLSPGNSNSSSGSNKTPQNNMSTSPSKPPNPTTMNPITYVPPAPPPPFFQGKGNSLKMPPPPPSQLAQVSALGKDGAPLPKLKPLHWDKVRAAPDQSMVWDKLRSSSFELDEEMIESLFGYNLQNSMKNDEAKSKSPSPNKHVLDPKRLQNITILSKALNVTAEQVCDALVQGKGLCLQQLEALVKMVPTKEEETNLSSYKGDISELGSAEKFVKAMLNVPFAFQRIEAMLYRETFEDEVVHLRKSFSMLEDACKELRSSRLFLKLLEAVLKTGNRMNVGTIRGGARAFKLDALLKLSDVKGIDGKTTLLHFVVQEMIRTEGIKESETIVGRMNQRRKTIKEREEDYQRTGLELVSGLSNELCNVKKTATIDIDVLASSVSNLSEGLSKLKILVHNDLCGDKNGGNFVHSMNSFLDYAEKKLKELQEDEDKVLLHVREITEYFHGNVSKDEANPLRIFVIVRDFLAMLDHVCKELRSSKIPTTPNPLAPFK